MNRVLLAILLLCLTFALAPEINTSARCPATGTCEIGDSETDAVQLTTDGASFDVDATANTATLTATTTSTATFTGADAAGAANTAYDTTGAGTVTVGSDDVTSVTIDTDGATLGIDTAVNVLTLTALSTSTATFKGADASGAADTALDTTGAGAITIGSADVTSVSVVTDGGTITLDGSTTGIQPVATSTGGALTVNTITMATAAADYDLPDSCDSATGNWVTLVVADPSETASLTVSAAEDTIEVGGLNLDADDELDSPTAAATSDGSSITVVCAEANIWFSTAIVGTWVDGGAAD